MEKGESKWKGTKRAFPPRSDGLYLSTATTLAVINGQPGVVIERQGVSSSYRMGGDGDGIGKGIEILMPMVKEWG